MMVPPHHTIAYETYRPPRVPKAFKDIETKMNWLLKLLTIVADRQCGTYAQEIETLKRCIYKTDEQYDDKLELDQILADSKNVSGGPIAPVKIARALANALSEVILGKR